MTVGRQSIVGETLYVCACGLGSACGEPGEEAGSGCGLAVAPALAGQWLLVWYLVFAGLVITCWSLVLRRCDWGTDVQG